MKAPSPPSASSSRPRRSSGLPCPSAPDPTSLSGSPFAHSRPSGSESHGFLHFRRPDLAILALPAQSHPVFSSLRLENRRFSAFQPRVIQSLQSRTLFRAVGPRHNFGSSRSSCFATQVPEAPASASWRQERHHPRAAPPPATAAACRRAPRQRAARNDRHWQKCLQGQALRLVRVPGTNGMNLGAEYAASAVRATTYAGSPRP